jgi:hypothetical protein
MRQKEDVQGNPHAEKPNEWPENGAYSIRYTAIMILGVASISVST